MSSDKDFHYKTRNSYSYESSPIYISSYDIYVFMEDMLSCKDYEISSDSISISDKLIRGDEVPAAPEERGPSSSPRGVGSPELQRRRGPRSPRGSREERGPRSLAGADRWFCCGHTLVSPLTMNPKAVKGESKCPLLFNYIHYSKTSIVQTTWF